MGTIISFEEFFQKSLQIIGLILLAWVAFSHPGDGITMEYLLNHSLRRGHCLESNTVIGLLYVFKGLEEFGRLREKCPFGTRTGLVRVGIPPLLIQRNSLCADDVLEVLSKSLDSENFAQLPRNAMNKTALLSIAFLAEKCFKAEFTHSDGDRQFQSVHSEATQAEQGEQGFPRRGVGDVDTGELDVFIMNFSNCNFFYLSVEPEKALFLQDPDVEELFGDSLNKDHIFL